MCCVFFFFFQAEDGIRDVAVTGVQTCALPIWEVTQTCLLCVAGLLGPSQPEVAGVSPDKAGAASAIAPWKRPAPHVIIETERGKRTLERYPDVAPRTVARFVELGKKGFYNGLTFHRVVPQALTQGG